MADGDAPRPSGVEADLTVVVGVDASDVARAALVWAARYAELVGGRVEVVHAWHPHETYVWMPDLPPPVPPTDVARKALQDLVDDVVGDRPVPVTAEVVEGHAGRVLVDRSRSADLLVVGSRGHGGFDGLALGSVSGHCAEHARCSVMIVRPPVG